MSAFERSPDPSSLRVISGFDEMWPSRWSPAIRWPRSRSQNTVSLGLWPGRKRDLEGAVAQFDAVAVVKHPRDLHSRAPGAEGPRDGLERRRHVLADAVAEHHVPGEIVLGLGLDGEVLDELHRGVDRGDLGAGVRRHERHEPEMVDVLVGEQHELDVLERVAQIRDSALEHVERGAGVGAGIDQRERVVLDQVDVHAPDREGRGDREPVDAGGGRGRVGVAHDGEVRPG